MKNSLALLLSFFMIAAFSAINPGNLSCEYLNNCPLVDVPAPRLSWINVADSGERGQSQSAYQIRVATSSDKLEEADLWDSKKVLGNECFRIVYSGKKLLSQQTCFWQVRVWDKNGTPSNWSSPASWHMGLLNASDWKAKWIGAPWQGEETLLKPTHPGGPDLLKELPPPAPYFRKSFPINKEIVSALAYVTGLGYFEFYVNGEKVGTDVLVPNQTNFGKRKGLMQENIPLPDSFTDYKIMYLSYDIKNQLSNGENVLGGIVGNGFYNPAMYWAQGYGSPRFLMQLHITYSDGSTEMIITDESWKASKSPIVFDMVYYGEHYDARLEQDAWNKSGFDDTQWERVAIRKAPYGRMVAHTAHTDKVIERIHPVRMERSYDGRYRIDFGEEVSGWVRLNNISDTAGRKIEIKYLSNLYSGDNSYIFNGKPNQSYAARFNWFVFREIEIINWEGNLDPEQIVAEVLHTQVEQTALFETSNDLINKIVKIWRRSQTDNMHGGIASDCPHRERSPYTGDGQVASAMVMQNYDARNFYHKWIHDIIGAQDLNTGYVPNCAPWQPGCGGGFAWGAAICIMPWEFYSHYGAKDILTDSYSGMINYLRYMKTWLGSDGIMHSKRIGHNGKELRWFNLGEWVTPGDMPADELVHTFYYWMCADITSKTAKVLGNIKDADIYASIAENTRTSFLKRFYNVETSSFGNGGSNVFALKMGVTDSIYAGVVNSLKLELEKHNNHLTTGIFGTRYLFEVLSACGLEQVAYEVLNKKTEPSFGRWIELGATTSREHWAQAGSFNHPMFGGGLIWFFEEVAGMKYDKLLPAYQHIIFKPGLQFDLDAAKYYNTTSYGRAGIEWKKTIDSYILMVEIPVGCNATIILPLVEEKNMFESKSNALNQPNIEFIKNQDGQSIFHLTSGKYSFSIRK